MPLIWDGAHSGSIQEKKDSRRSGDNPKRLSFVPSCIGGEAFSISGNTDSTLKNRIGNWGRVAVMFLSGGFIFPHAMTEDDDIVKQDADKEATAKKE